MSNNRGKKPLFLPIINRKGFTKAEIELLQEMDPDIQILPDGSYTINGETPEQIRSKYDRLMKELAQPSRPKLKLIPGKKERGSK